MNHRSFKIISTSLILLIAAACTKELPFEEKLKVEVFDKSMIDSKADYLMSSSMLNASRSSTDALPYSAGDNKRVRFQWTETALQVIEMDKDARFQDNDTNNKLVMEVPVEHVDYRCAKDKYGDCTNSEEERSDVNWDKKGKFKFKAEAAKSARLETLPILLDSKLDMGFCYSEVASKVVDLKLEKDALNIAIQRTFNLSPFCVDIHDMSDTTVSAVFHYSFVMTKAVLSPNFQPIQYPKRDEDAFGFFKTETNVLDIDNNAVESGTKVLLNHWNPEREEIKYYLTDNFYKPENKKILELTKEVFISINLGLKNSGAKFHLTLDEEKGRSPGDIRNSMIVMVEDPVASSVIGYGPQVEDPSTGEIISAKTAMFLGTIKTIVKFTYDSILNDRLHSKLMAAGAAIVPSPVVTPAGAVSEDNSSSDPDGGLDIENSLRANWAKKVVSGSRGVAVKKTSSLDFPNMQKGVASISPQFNKMKANPSSLRRDYRGGAAERLQYLKEAKNCAYSFNGEVVTGISQKLSRAIPEDAKPWDQLSEGERQAIMDLILPEIWVSTLIHEMGHNLGLRHNFSGSEDEANFYSKSELEKMNIDHKIPASTVMEYIDDTQALHVMGKYDIAALRFAYARKIELNDGSILDIKGTLKDTIANSKDPSLGGRIKPYKYCSDEGADINPGCRRFDLGVNYTEITENAIKEYKNRYNYANFRNGRLSFSSWDDGVYAARIARTFMQIRLVQEFREKLINEFNIPEGDSLWTSDPFLVDVDRASKLAGEFLVDVMMMPDLTCVIGDVNTGEIVDQTTLSGNLKVLTSCEELSPYLASSGRYVIASFGKLFSSRKKMDSENNIAGEVDVRGYWIDKMIAAKMLLQRKLFSEVRSSLLDDSTDNFLDRADIGPMILGSIVTHIANIAQAKVDLTNYTFDKNTLLISPASIQSGVVVNLNSDMVVDTPIHPVIAAQLGVPYGPTKFNAILTKLVADHTVDESHRSTGNAQLDLFRIVRGRDNDNWKGYTILKNGGVVYGAAEENKLGQSLIDSSEIAKTLEGIARERLIELYKLKASKTPAPADLNDAEKAAWNVPTDDILRFLVGDFASSSFYLDLLMGLPN